MCQSWLCSPSVLPKCLSFWVKDVITSSLLLLEENYYFYFTQLMYFFFSFAALIILFYRFIVLLSDQKVHLKDLHITLLLPYFSIWKDDLGSGFKKIWCRVFLPNYLWYQIYQQMLLAETEYTRWWYCIWFHTGILAMLSRRVYFI